MYRVSRTTWGITLGRLYLISNFPRLNPHMYGVGGLALSHSRTQKILTAFPFCTVAAESVLASAAAVLGYRHWDVTQRVVFLDYAHRAIVSSIGGCRLAELCSFNSRQQRQTKKLYYHRA